jgi:hypothetical protein
MTRLPLLGAGVKKKPPCACKLGYGVPVKPQWDRPGRLPILLHYRHLRAQAPDWHFAPIRRYHVFRVGVCRPMTPWRRHHGRESRHPQHGHVYQLEMPLAILQKQAHKKGKKPRYETRERLLILWYIEAFPIPRRKVSRHFGIARSTLYRWLHKIEDQKPSGTPVNKTPTEIASLVPPISNATSSSRHDSPPTARRMQRSFCYVASVL